MSPAARPARAGTAAMNGSAPPSAPVLLAPRTPRFRSRIAPPTARAMTSSSNAIRRGPARRPSPPARPATADPNAVGAIAATSRTTVTVATTSGMTIVAGSSPPGIARSARAIAASAAGITSARPSPTVAPTIWAGDAPRERDSASAARRRPEPRRTTRPSAAPATAAGPIATAVRTASADRQRACCASMNARSPLRRIVPLTAPPTTAEAGKTLSSRRRPTSTSSTPPDPSRSGSTRYRQA